MQKKEKEKLEEIKKKAHQHNSSRHAWSNSIKRSSKPQFEQWFLVVSGFLFFLDFRVLRRHFLGLFIHLFRCFMSLIRFLWCYRLRRFLFWNLHIGCFHFSNFFVRSFDNIFFFFLRFNYCFGKFLGFIYLFYLLRFVFGWALLFFILRAQVWEQF